MTGKTGENGQALLEFIISASFSGAILVGIAFLMKDYWDHFECQRITFETAHALLVKKNLPKTPDSCVRLSAESPRGSQVRAQFKCGNIQEEEVILHRVDL